MRDPKEIVRSGYDRISEAYRGDRLDEGDGLYARYKWRFEQVARRVEAGAAVLDLGCGCGVPLAQLLAGSYQVTGVDISPVQIERARRLVPGARFVCGDMCQVDFPPGTFAAIICLFAIIHVPTEEQAGLLAAVGRWLQPGGYFLVSVGRSNWTGEEKDWLGVEGGDMYWSHADRQTYLGWFAEQGMAVEWERFIPEGEGGHPLFLLRKTAAE